MNTKSTLRRGTALAAPCLLLVAIAISAQMERKLAQSQQENAMALRQYQWKSRMEIQKGGEPKKVELWLMRYDANGNLQKTVISSTPEPDLPRFGLRKIVAQKKVQEFKETVQELGALATSYGELSPERMQRFMATATVTPEIIAQHKSIRIEGRDVLQVGDSMTVFLDAVSHKRRRVEIQTSLHQKPVRIVSEFADLPQGGPTHLVRSQTSFDGTSMVIVTDNFDYSRVQANRGTLANGLGA